MTDQKTLPTSANVDDYIQAIEESTRREDCKLLMALMSEITGKPAVMWGNGIVGFDQYHYHSTSREGIWMRIGFAHRVGPISLYRVSTFPDAESYLARLGKFKLGKGCLYIKKLADIDIEVLKEMIKQGYLDNKQTNPADGK